MREILFRGKRTSDGEWIEGTLFRLASKLHPFIMLTDRYAESYEVDSETVGQFTGLIDKNGKKVFEGDIFATKCNKGVITFDDDAGVFGFQIWWKGFPDDFATLKEFGKPEFEIIGNIHENPELLEKK